MFSSAVLTYPDADEEDALALRPALLARPFPVLFDKNFLVTGVLSSVNDLFIFDLFDQMNLVN
jgi:hypothetical protein